MMRINNKELVITLKDPNYFYDNFKKIKRLSKKNKIKVKYHKIKPSDKKEIEVLVKALNIKDTEERLSYIYDKACDFIDENYINKNICEFENGTCVCQRCTNMPKRINGCCGNCRFNTPTGCSQRCLACKLFYCEYIRKRKDIFEIDDIKVLKYFLNRRQKFMLKYDIFMPKEDVLKDLKHNSLFLWSLTRIDMNEVYPEGREWMNIKKNISKKFKDR